MQVEYIVSKQWVDATYSAYVNLENKQVHIYCTNKENTHTVRVATYIWSNNTIVGMAPTELRTELTKALVEAIYVK